MTKVVFSSSTKKFCLAEYAIAKGDESPVEAVERSIARTTGYRVVSGGVRSWTENSKGIKESETINITLTEKKQFRRGGGYGVVGEFRVCVYF